jgi:hypothetical protein
MNIWQQMLILQLSEEFISTRTTDPLLGAQMGRNIFPEHKFLAQITSDGKFGTAMDRILAKRFITHWTLMIMNIGLFNAFTDAAGGEFAIHLM